MEASEESTTTAVASESENEEFLSIIPAVKSTEAAAAATAVLDDKTDYDEVTLNPLLAEIEAETTSELDSKNKPRRYWTPKEEERFFEIWGRENWRLTRHGKNTVYFAKWSDELMERFGVDVKPEEVQAKVNQTRAKFRAVKKQLDADDKATRWKKYDIIEKILNNKFRSEDAEPLPADVHENNRDITPNTGGGGGGGGSTSATTTVVRQPTPTSSTSNSMPETAIAVATSLTTLNQSEAGVAIEPQITVDPSVVNVALEHNLSVGLFNTSNDGESRANYSTELFSDQIDIVKQEFEDEYNAFQYQQPSVPQPTTEQNHYAAVPPPEQPQLHQLQTPQQQQQQQQLQQQYQSPQQQYTPPPPPAAVSPATVAHQQSFAGGYDHSTNAYANQNRSLLLNAQNSHYGATPSVANPSTQYNNNNNNSYANTNNSNNNTASMQPPRPNMIPTPQPRKRTRGPAPSTIAALSGPPAPDSVEAQYLEEVRKKNHILEEQKNISAKRLVLEERKITLMEEFFPKCLAMQEQIMERLNNT